MSASVIVVRYGDQRDEILDQPELDRVVPHPVAQVGQQKRDPAPSALERLEIGFIGRERKAAAGGLDVDDRRQQGLKVMQGLRDSVRSRRSAP